MIQLKNSGANVFFNITTPKFAAQAIKKAAEIGWKPVHYLNNVSSSFGSVFKPAGIEASQGVILALYRKDVNDSQLDDVGRCEGVQGVHGEVHAAGQPEGRYPQLRLLGCSHDDRSPEACGR